LGSNANSLLSYTPVRRGEKASPAAVITVLVPWYCSLPSQLSNLQPPAALHAFRYSWT